MHFTQLSVIFTKFSSRIALTCFNDVSGADTNGNYPEMKDSVGGESSYQLVKISLHRKFFKKNQHRIVEVTSTVIGRHLKTQRRKRIEIIERIQNFHKMNLKIKKFFFIPVFKFVFFFRKVSILFFRTILYHCP